MNYSIIGTAGHIDHGKSSLIKELTGFWGDETNEEKKRGITINLSFSYLKTEQKTIGFIDVPGHEKFISTMVSGAFGFDACLIVIDAKEGIMPQTKEHLEVLNFLHVKQCVIAVTKCDLVEQNQIEKQILNIQNELKNYINLHVNCILQTSIKDKNSINTLKNILLNLPKIEHKSTDIFRYYIDRVFSLKGIGTVVTGTVLDGFVKLEQKVWISQLQNEAQIKNIQIHEDFVEEANIRQRVALNLAKINFQDLKSGMLLTKKGYIRGFNKIDVFLKSIKNKIIPHDVEVFFHIGSQKISGKLLHVDSQNQFSEGFSTFVAKEKIFSVFDDKCIISHNGHVIAGGYVVNSIQDPLKKRQKMPILKALHNKDFKNAFYILSKNHKKGFGLISSYQRFNLDHEKALEIAKGVEDVFIDEKSLIIYRIEALQDVKKIILNIFNKNPYALISATSLSIKHKWISEKLANFALESFDDEIIFTNGIWAKNGISTKELFENIEQKIYNILEKNKYEPPAPYNIYDDLDIDRKIGDNALKSLTRAKKVIRLEHNLFICSNMLSKIMTLCRNIIKQNGYIDIKNFKENLNLSRKYLIAYLEYLDKFDDILKDGTKRFI